MGTPPSPGIAYRVGRHAHRVVNHQVVRDDGRSDPTEMMCDESCLIVGRPPGWDVDFVIMLAARAGLRRFLGSRGGAWVSDPAGVTGDPVLFPSEVPAPRSVSRPARSAAEWAVSGGGSGV